MKVKTFIECPDLLGKTFIKKSFILLIDITLKKVCLTDRNIGYLYLYLYTYLVSCLLCGVGSSSLRL